MALILSTIYGHLPYQKVERLDIYYYCYIKINVQQMYLCVLDQFLNGPNLMGIMVICDVWSLKINNKIR